MTEMNVILHLNNNKDKSIFSLHLTFQSFNTFDYNKHINL